MVQLGWEQKGCEDGGGRNECLSEYVCGRARVCVCLYCPDSLKTNVNQF